jgi:psiF repeat
MFRRTLAAVVLVACPAVLSSRAPSHAVTAKDRMATCKFGADDQHLQGKARGAFMKKCMSNADEPRGASAAPGGQH